MRKILFLSFHFPPAKAVGGKRISRLIRCFSKRGWESGVVTSDPELSEGTEAGHTLAPHLREIPKVYCGADRRPLMQRWLDRTAGWMPNAYRSAREMLQRPDWSGATDPVVLYSSSPPVTTHVVARRLKRELGKRIFWVADFRDPWIYPDSPVFTPWGLINRWTYGRVRQEADLLVGTTDTIVENVSRGTPDAAERGVLFRNTVDRDLFDGIEPVGSADGEIQLCHFGDLDYESRNPRNLLRGLGKLLQNGALGNRDCQVHFYGTVGTWQGKSIPDFCREYGVEGKVHVHGFVPHREALARILGSDVLILFANAQAPQIPSKIYEYLYANRTILAFCDSGETHRLLTRAKTAVVVEKNDETLVEAALKRIVGELQAGTTQRNDPEFLNGLTTETCFGPFYEALEKRIQARSR